MSNHTRRSRLRLGRILLGGLLLLFSPCVRIGLGQSDGQALEVLKRMAETYRSLKSYQFEGVMKRESKAEGYQQTREIPILKAAVLPDKLRIERGWPKNKMVLVSNSQDSWLYLAQLRQYSRTNPGDIKRFLEQGPSDEPATFSALYNSFVTQYANLTELVKQARILREESLDLGGSAKPCYVVEINNRETEEGRSERNYPRTLWIEKDRYLVLKEISGSRSESPEFEGMLETRQTLVLSLAKINEQLPQDLFVFQPPAGTHEIQFAGIRQPRRRSLEGEIAKDFTLKDLKGDSVSLKSLRGKVVLLNFWATWCGPCRIEMPLIDHLQEEYRDQGLVVLGITDEAPELALKFLAKIQISFAALTDPEQEVAVLYQVRAIPTIFVIGRDGRIVYQGIGVSREEALRTALKDAGIAAQ